MLFNNKIELYGADADEFLESVGVELYDDCIAIEESVLDGEFGEFILNENGIFLYEDGIVLEGQQADEYRARKAKEKKDMERTRENEYQKRFGDRENTTELSYQDMKPNTRNRIYKTGAVNNLRVRNTKLTPDQKQKHFDKMERYQKQAHIDLAKEANKREFNKYWCNDNNDDYLRQRRHLSYAVDGRARNERKKAKKIKKPTNESGIFESVEMI